jgi:hypothetical protein
MEGRINLILESALNLSKTPFGAGMEPLIVNLEALGDSLMNGNDANSNSLIEPIDGECGATDAYNLAYAMADMFLFPGENRIPPNGK